MTTYSKEKSNEPNESNEETNNEENVNESGLTSDQESSLLKQIETEHKDGLEHIKPKRNQWLMRLKLYNNQSRKANKVGDPLMFTVFQTVFSALYDDKLATEFEANDEGDEDTVVNLTALAEFDFKVMKKAALDYDWLWNTLFFGKALIRLSEFDRDLMCPVPSVIDPLLWIRDPKASSVNGDMKGNGAMRYGGQEKLLTKREMTEDLGFIQENVNQLQKGKKIDSVVEDSQQARDAAQNRQETNIDEKDSDDTGYAYTVIEWFTYHDDQRVIVTVSQDFKHILRIQEIEMNEWPLVDRSIFPIPGDWDGVSIPDLTEDKQRARAKMTNLGLDGAVASLHPMYLYNKKKIKRKSDLNFGFNKAVGIDGAVDGAYQVMHTSKTIDSNVDYVMGLLERSAQRAVAAPDLAQGISPTKSRTLGEQEMMAAGRSARMSVAAALLSRSEENFWSLWRWLYNNHFAEEIDEKVIRIRGPLANSWRTLTKENINTKVDPDINVVSREVAEARRKREFATFSQFTQIVLQAPGANKRYVLRKLAKIQGIKPEEMSLMLPPTPDERLAEDENTILNENKFVKANMSDDHTAHLEMHMKANQTPATAAHIHAHKIMLQQRKNNPEHFPAQTTEEDRVMNYDPVQAQGVQKQPLTAKEL